MAHLRTNSSCFVSVKNKSFYVTECQRPQSPFGDWWHWNLPLLLQTTTLCPYREDIYYVYFPTSTSCSLCNHSNIVLGMTFSLLDTVWWYGQSRLEKDWKSCSQIHSHNGDLKKLPITFCDLESRLCPSSCSAFSASSYPCELHKSPHETFLCLVSFSFPCW